MPEITVSDEIFSRLLAFKQVVDAVLEEQIGVEECAKIVLEQGVESMLADILGTADATVLLQSVQRLGAQHPAVVYGFVAETLRRGASHERERMRRQLGFRPRDELES